MTDNETPTKIPCPHDCKRFGGRVPGHVRGSNWDWVPCWCNGTGFIDAPVVACTIAPEPEQ